MRAQTKPTKPISPQFSAFKKYSAPILCLKTGLSKSCNWFNSSQIENWEKTYRFWAQNVTGWTEKLGNDDLKKILKKILPP